MKWGYQQTLDALREAIALPWRSITIGVRTPPPADIRYLALGQPRAVIPLRGIKHIRYASQEGVISRGFYPGEVLICNADVWCEEGWQNPHTMFSIVMRPEYLRLLTIDYRHLELPPDQNPEGYFFHTPGTPPPALYHTLSALLSNAEPQEAALLNFQSLLRYTEHLLIHLPAELPEKANYSWACIRDYLDKNFTMSLDRVGIAEALHLHPATLSRLVKKHTGFGVTEYLTQLRLNYATMLLQDRQYSIKEIAYAAGFNHENYFIRVFRKRFLTSPGSYREPKSRQIVARNI